MNCKTCHHSNTKNNPAMARVGYCNCVLGPKWKFYAPTFTCNKWSKKA